MSTSNQPNPNIGKTEAKCPYCKSELEKFPGRKKKCRNCNNYIYVRTRPIDEKKILIKEGQIELVKELWAIKNGNEDEYYAKKERISKEKNELQKNLGRELTEEEINISLRKKELSNFAQNNKWGLFRNAKWEIASNLFKLNRYEEALKIFLEVNYLDINGPSNVGNISDELIERFPPFRPKKFGKIAPASTSYLNKLKEKNDFSLGEIEKRFRKVASRLKEDLDLPVSIDEAWNKIENEVFMNQNT